MRVFVQSLLLMSLLAVGLFGRAAFAADLYRWEDAEGNVSYGDAPPVQGNVTNVKKVDGTLPKLNDAPAMKTLPAADNSGNQGSTQQKELSADYEAITILQPQNDTSVRENAGNVTISVQLSPPLKVRAGHLLAIYLDGKEVALGTASSITIPNVDRGTHQVQAKVLDNSGQAIESSSVSTFTLHRHSVLH